MRLNWKKAESYEKPLEVDTKLSNSGIYYRRNIEEVEAEAGVKYCYEEVLLSNDFRFNIENIAEYIEAIERKIALINSQLHITKLDFFNNFCKPVGITIEILEAKVAELGMEADWKYCNHVYYGVIKPFLQALPLGKTEEEIIAIFEALSK